MAFSSDYPTDIRVRGAREHNLKNIDVNIPRDALVAFTGISGSGKSSLAFGTIYAESQRRYCESVAPYARRLIDQVGVPEVDSIEGLPPAVAVAQNRGGVNARSSVGSVTTISSAVRLLYSRAGSYPMGQPMLYAEDFSPNTAAGACSICHGIGAVYDATEESMVLDPSLTIRNRAIAAWPTAWHGKQLRDVLISLGINVDIPWQDMPKDQRDWILFTDETPQMPVFTDLAPEQVPAAIAHGNEPSYYGTFVGAKRYVLETFANSRSEAMRKRAYQFMITSVCPACHGKRLKPEALSVKFEGLDITEMAHLTLEQLKELLLSVVADNWVPIDSYADAILPDETTRTASITARVNAGGSAHAAAADIRRTKNFSEEKYISAKRLSQELLARIEPIISLGLGYISLDRATPTLSSGELQRIRLATQLLSQLFGVVFVLDEPSAGLHPADREALLKILHGLKNRGNTVFVVEHALEVIRACDWIVDIGPLAGSKGGQVVYSGELPGIKNVPTSITGKYLYPDALASNRGKCCQENRHREPQGWLQLSNVYWRNLKNLTTAFPLGCITAVTGVSGSGKTSLVSQAIPELVHIHMLGIAEPTTFAEDHESAEEILLSPQESRDISGTISCPAHAFRRLVQVSQKPIGRTPRSNIATYTGVFDLIRKLFAGTPESRQRHYTASRFSFNVLQGRCAVCKGEGTLSVELLFLPTVYAPCSACAGTRYNPDTLEIRWKDLNIAQVLALTIDDACTFFCDEKDIHRYLSALHEVGLGYLSLGHSATELSGGEAQRVKLATELHRAGRGDTLYILDEPTAGLHPADTDKLMHHLNALVDAGNTVILVEHDMRVVAHADWVIDLGPGAGDHGGKIVAEGTPERIITHTHSQTATYLKQELHDLNTVYGT